MLDHVDRSGCPATYHGSIWAYKNGGCRCPDMRDEYNRWRKLGEAGIRPPRIFPAFVVARRLQALAALGWSAEDLAPIMGISSSAVQKLRVGTRRWVFSENAAKVLVIYETLSGTPGPSPWIRRWAKSHHWYPPLAWEDIDDENERPRYGAVGVQRERVSVDQVAIRRAMRGDRVHLSPTERDLAVAELHRAGATRLAIAQTLRVTVRTVDRIIAGQRARESVEGGV